MERETWATKPSLKTLQASEEKKKGRGKFGTSIPSVFCAGGGKKGVLKKRSGIKGSEEYRNEGSDKRESSTGCTSRTPRKHLNLIEPGFV